MGSGMHMEFASERIRHAMHTRSLLDIESRAFDNKGLRQEERRR